MTTLSTTIIQIKSSNEPGKIPLPGDLTSAELAYNTYDGYLYAKRERPGIGTDVINIGAGVSVSNIVYVTKDGQDTNTGRKIGEAKGTIGGAVAISTSGTVIKVAPGTYIENNPITLPPNVSIIGEGVKEVSINPSNNSDVFYLSDGNCISNVSFNGSPLQKSIFAFNPVGNINLTKPPFIHNCVNNISNSIGINLDGSKISSLLKSVFVETYDQYNQNGIGISVTNEAYVQIKSSFNICNQTAVYAGTGGVCNIIGSNTTFGTYGMVANGISSTGIVGTISTTTSANTDTFVVTGLSTGSNPNQEQVAYFDRIYYTVNRISVGYGGTGYIRRPTITINSPETSWGIKASAIANISNGSVTSIDIVSNGIGYTSAPSITISSPDVGINTASATAIISPVYYSVQNSTPVVSGVSTITLGENLPYSVGIGTQVYFRKQSRILGSNHTFEYVGSGVVLSNAFPSAGGKGVQDNETVSQDGGIVVFSSIDQSGNYKIGEGVVINQNAGTISGSVYTRSLFNNVTPLILALGGE